MTDSHYGHADKGSVLSTALVAVILILAGLCVMAWDDGRDQRPAPTPLLQHT